MEVFEAPKKDAKGRPINAEDAEARQAAREKNAARKKAAAEKAAALEAARKAAEEAAALAEPAVPEKKSEKKKKAKTKVEITPVVEVAPAPVVKKEKERRTFPHGKQNLGSLQDFLDKQPDPDLAVPYTPHRNPLEGEVIMDATARLLASKPVYRYHTPSKPAPALEKKEKKAKTKRGKKEEHKAPVSVKSALPKEPERREPPKKGAPAPAKKRSGRKDRIPARVEAPASRQKDSTEQKSLMKPFYISHD
jgi:ATP-dependent RNA helicase RhlE